MKTWHAKEGDGYVFWQGSGVTVGATSPKALEIARVQIGLGTLGVIMEKGVPCLVRLERLKPEDDTIEVPVSLV